MLISTVIKHRIQHNPYSPLMCFLYQLLKYFICSHDCHWHYLAFALCGNLESTFFERRYLCQVLFVFAACALRKYTYADAGYLRELFMPVILRDDIRILSIATRPDCFSESIYDLLSECNQIKPVWVELGLQTIHEKTALKIRRGYPLSCFEQTVKELQKRNIPVIVHIILGLPGESTKEVLETIEYLNALDIQGIKLQLLHILKDTDLAKELPTLSLLSEEEYIALLLQCIAHLSPDIVIHRLTGDGPKELLLAPLWSLHKRHVLNRIAHQLKEEQIYQGMDYQKKK